jgi:hypothetical protein
MLTVICFKWKTPDWWTGPSRCEFKAEHVNILENMVARHYHKPHRFVCITDDPEGINGETFPIWDDLADVRNPMDRWVSCYRRLKIFSKEMIPLFGPRIVVLDIDTIIVDDVTPLWDRPEPFVGIRLNTGNIQQKRYGGAMYLMDTGAFSEVFDDFDPETSPQECIDAGLMGSDQAWLSYKLGPDQAVWTRNEGVLSSKLDRCLRCNHVRPRCRIVMFHGKPRPWEHNAQKLRWVAEHWK